MEPRSDSLQKIDHLFAEATASGRFGGTVAISVRGHSIFSKAFGTADVGTRVQFEPTTSSQVASVSKQFAAAAILLLEEDEELSRTDLLSRWVRPSPAHWEGIQLHHLLTHTSGLPHWRDLPSLDLFTPVPEEEILEAFASCDLKFAPGTGWYYSSPGYHLLARVVERVSGQPYGEFVQSRIFSPLRMQHSFVGNRTPEGIARAEGLGDSGRLPSFDLDTTGKGAGDIWSTAEDLLQWDGALSVPGPLLTAPSLEAMFRPYSRLPPEQSASAPALADPSYGYGWYLATLDGAPVRFHSGDNNGYRALNAWVPGADLRFAFCSNQESTNVVTLGLGALKQLVRKH
jgi:CubicO group peptidase (beta-lactamase class C family)